MPVKLGSHEAVAEYKSPANRGEVKSKTPEGVFADFHRFLFLCVFIGLSRFFTGFHRFVFLPLDLSPSFVGLLLIPVSVNKTLHQRRNISLRNLD